MEPDALLCSRNARPPKVLVGRAQVRFSVLTPQKEGETSELGKTIRMTKLRPPPHWAPGATWGLLLDLAPVTRCCFEAC